MPALTQLPAWKNLERHCTEMQDVHLREMFAADPGRFDRLHLRVGEVLVDYSKQRINEETLRLLLRLAEDTGLSARIEAMFRGDKINLTENRAVLHVALRNRSNRPILVDGVDVMPEVNRVLEQMRGFVRQITGGEWLGYSGQPISDVVNIGIGGSDLGPRMAVRALAPYARKGPRVHFVSNVDGADLLGVLHGLNPETTLFIVASKTFTTLETMLNARSARQWLLATAGDSSAVRRHFVALSSDAQEVAEFGIDPHNMFEFWDWVGGRFSLWSAIGLSIALAIGMDYFEELLSGAHEVDQHFRSTPLAQNLPVILGLIGIWNINFLGAESHAVLPYDQRLEFLPAFLQQADMESNGKRVDLDGREVDYATGPILWGQPGTNGQHAFYQLLHQGTRLVPCDFLLAARPYALLHEHQEALVANCLAQSKALMRGRTYHEAKAELEAEGFSGEHLEMLAHAKTFPGNKPSTTFLYPALTPRVLGNLLALYEHKIFVQGSIWHINSFDQMGVELGKSLAASILQALPGEERVCEHDASTNGLIAHYKAWR